MFLAKIKLQIGYVPATWDGASFQSLKLIRVIPLGFGYSEGSCPLGRQLVLQLIRMSLPHDQVSYLELSRLHLRVVLMLHPSLHCFSLYPRLFSLKFLHLCRTGQTLGSMVRWWHRKSGSMPGMSEADHANASRWRKIIAATLSCSS